MLEDSSSDEPEKPSERGEGEDALEHLRHAMARIRRQRGQGRMGDPKPVRFAPSEVEAIQTRAERLGLSFSTYVRIAALAIEEEPFLGAVFADRFEATLSRLRNTLIAKTKAAVRSELKERENADTEKGSESHEAVRAVPNTRNLSRAILHEIVPVIDEELDRLEATLDELRQKHPPSAGAGEEQAAAEERAKDESQEGGDGQ